MQKRETHPAALTVFVSGQMLTKYLYLVAEKCINVLQGVYICMSEKHVPKLPQSLIPVPVPSDDRQQQPLLQQPSWWELCTHWVRYHSIQILWDIERSLARLFHRRWSG